MAYSKNNLAMVGIGPIANSQAARLWTYQDTVSDATVYAAGYIADAGAFGMKVNDIVLYIKTDTFNLFVHTCIAINATTGGATLSSTSVPDAH